MDRYLLILALLIGFTFQPTCQAQEGEQFLFTVPKTWGQWKTVTNQVNEKQTFIEKIPEAQDLSAIKDLIVEQSFSSLPPSATPANFLTLMIHGPTPGSCEQFLGYGPYTEVQYGSATAYGRYFCSKLKGKQYGVISLLKAVRGKDKMYLIQREWRVPPFDLTMLNKATGLIPRKAFPSETEALAWYEAYTAAESLLASSAFVCDSRDITKPCPKKQTPNPSVNTDAAR